MSPKWGSTARCFDIKHAVTKATPWDDPVSWLLASFWEDPVARSGIVSAGIISFTLAPLILSNIWASKWRFTRWPWSIIDMIGKDVIIVIRGPMPSSILYERVSVGCH